MRAVFGRRRAHNVLKGFRKLAAVVVAEAAGDLQHRAVGFGEHEGGGLHFLPARVREKGDAVHELETGFDLCAGDVEVLGELLERDAAVHVCREICADRLGQRDLRAGYKVLLGFGLLYGHGAQK